jgi:CxxC motif-containing protein (DUF1111 family)
MIRFHPSYLVRCLALAAAGAILATAQTDPGPRGGPAAAGSFYPSLNATEQASFKNALSTFKEVDSVTGTVPGQSGSGLGPTFNGNSCAQCHAQPAAGGSSPGLASKQNPIPNPQVALATMNGAQNTVPSFITANGPVREARFVSTDPTNASAPLDGGVHGLYTIRGRTDAPGCNLAQPDFAGQMARGNVIFRIPTAVFGLGLVEYTPDEVLVANLAANRPLKALLGINGRFNTSGNDGTITRFGWKAQNKSLLIFAAEAYNVEQGVNNELFPNERSAVPGCVFNPGTEDDTHSTGNSDVVDFAIFMRLSAPPVPTTATASELNGKALFNSVGCALCHTPTLTTGRSPYTGMSNVTYSPYSDFALHDMGANLSDGILQGVAGPDEFRTAPLWGLGQRLYFLHDGRTNNLFTAIQAHATPGTSCLTWSENRWFNVNGGPVFFRPNGQDLQCGSEANGVIGAFNALPAAGKQDILNFLRSL